MSEAQTGSAALNDQPLRVGVAGLGFGCTEFMPALEQMPQIKMVAAADLHRPHALEAFKTRYGANGYRNVAELCTDPEVEAIWIATPNQFHGEHALLAAQHGKHLVVRKPFGLNVEECQRVLEAADKTGVKILAGGQTQGTNALIREIRRMMLSGELGALRAINMWAFTGWMLRPREAQEVDDSQGGGIVWRQAPHQLETIRWLGGGLLRSVRAVTGSWRPERPNGTGYFTALMEFEDGTPATVSYNAYGFFDTTGLLPWAEDKALSERARARQALLSGSIDESREKEGTRFGARVEGETEPQIPWETGRSVVSSRGGPWLPGNQGVFLMSFDRGDIRASADGLYFYGEDGLREITVPQRRGEGMVFMDDEAMELINAVRHNAPMLHDGRWGLATAEVQWAILESARRREDIILKHQVAVPEGF
ncbi:MAG: Gfo/Idh/MocA family protein [Chloroflexota bacterium]